MVDREEKKIPISDGLKQILEKGLLGKLSDEEKTELDEVLFAEEQSSKSSFVLGDWID